MANAAPPSALGGRVAVWQLLILLGVCLLAFRRSGATIMRFALNDRDSAHLLAAPFLIGLLALRRRHELKQQLSRGSIWGVALVLAGLTAHAAAQWPFNFTGYPSWLTIVPIMAGIILAVGGWRLLKLCGPMLLILLLAIPISPRHYAFLIIGPETLTLRAVQVTLDLLPGVFVELAGPELSYFGSQGAGHIALGEPHRGASLFLAYLSITVFVTFASIRAPWQVTAMGFAAAPIALISNYSRLVMWGAVTIYGGAGPLSPYPRVIAMTLSLLGAWGLSVLGLLVASKIGNGPQPRLGSGKPRPAEIPE